jgi:hypothetical protein
MALSKNPEKPAESPAPQSPVPEFYANSVAINVSPFEVEMQHLLVDSAQTVKGAVNIRLSPQTAWTLSRALAKNLAEYESKFGPISLPEEIRKQLE